MKKLIVFCSMIVALGFVATGCGGGNQGSAPAPAPVEDAAPVEDTASAEASESAETESAESGDGE